MNSGATLVEEFCWELRRAFQELAEAGDEALRELGITASDRALLEFLAREDQPISISELARKRNVSRQHVQQSLRRLPDPAWVSHTEDPKDERAILLSLSRSGRALWAEVRKRDERFFESLARRSPRSHVLAGTTGLRELRKQIQLLTLSQGE